MLLQVSVEIDRPKAIKDLAALAARCENLSRPLTQLGLWHQRKASRILSGGARGIQTREPASGLAASITFAQPGPNDLMVGSNKVYARSQQLGPAGGYYESSRPGGYLAIPILDNLMARGRARYQSPRDVPDGFFFRTNEGKLFFGREKGRKRKAHSGQRSRALVDINADKLQVLFVLVTKARGQAHNYVTHDPDDQTAWARFVGKWLLEGK